MCASADRRTASPAPIATNALVAAVPTLCPTIIAQAWSNLSEPACSATSVVAAAALELCMTIDIRIPIPARIHCQPKPLPPTASRFHEMPSIPVWRYSIPKKSSPKPARIAPKDRVRPLAISQRKAPMPSSGMAKAETLTRKTKDRDQPWRRGRAESRAYDDPDRLREGDQSRADETNHGERRCGRGLDRHGEQRTGHNRTQAATDKRLQRAAQRVTREALQTLRKVVDPEQKQAKPTYQRDSGGRVHPLFLLRRVIEHNLRLAAPVHLSQS